MDFFDVRVLELIRSYIHIYIYIYIYILEICLLCSQIYSKATAPGFSNLIIIGSPFQLNNYSRIPIPVK